MIKKIRDLTVNEIDKICKTTSCEKCPFNKKSLLYSSLDTCYDIADLQRYKDKEIEVGIDEKEN